jgi:hypothetical protein
VNLLDILSFYWNSKYVSTKYTRINENIEIDYDIRVRITLIITFSLIKPLIRDDWPIFMFPDWFDNQLK